MSLWPLEHRGDFLTMPFRGSTSAWWSGRRYYEAPPDVARSYRAAILARGYTRIYFDLFGAWGPKENYFEQPDKLLPFLMEATADAIGPVLFIGPEDDKAAQARYAGVKGRRRYKDALKRLLSQCGADIADLVLGVEVEEYWSDDLVAEFGTHARRFYAGPIWVHRSTGEHGPWSWWKKQTWATGLAYQYNKRDKHNGFLAHPDDVRSETELYAARLRVQGGKKKLLAGEYAYKRPEQKAMALGTIGLRYGAVGFMNGGPPLQFRPQGAE